MNLKIHFSTVMFSCESCRIFKNTYFAEHWGTAASAINIDAKYSHPSQQVNTSINSAEKLGYSTAMSGQKMPLANFEDQ